MNLKVRLAIMNLPGICGLGSILDLYGPISWQSRNGNRNIMVLCHPGIVSIFMPTLMGIVADNTYSHKGCSDFVIWQQD